VRAAAPLAAAAHRPPLLGGRWTAGGALAIPARGFALARSGTAAQRLHGAAWASAAWLTPAANEARLERLPDDSLGLLVEGQRQNLVTYSRDYSNAAWTKALCSIATGQASPDGGATACLLTNDGSSGQHTCTLASARGAAGAATFSLICKGGTAAHVHLRFAVDSRWVQFNLATGAAGFSGGALTTESVALPGGWWLFRVGFTMTAANAPRIQALTAAANSAGPSEVSSATLHLWDAWFEQAPVGSSPIVAAGSQAVRNADALARALAPKAWAGSRLWRVRFGKGGLAQTVGSVDDGSNADRLTVRRSPAGALEAVGASAGSASSAGGSAVADATWANVGLAWQGGSARLYLDGAAAGALSWPNPGTMNAERLGLLADGADGLFGHLGRFRSWDHALDAATMRRLTAP
jgi:hypothetical protein